MQKSVIAVLFTLFVVLLSPTVSAVDGIDLVEPSLSANGIAMLFVPFTVSNTGTATLNVSFSGSILNATNSTQNATLTPILPLPLVDLLQGEQRLATVQVNTTAAIAGNYSGTIRVSANAVQDSVPLTITVPNNNLQISRIGSGTIAGASNSGQTFTSSVTLRNDRNTPVTSILTIAPGFGSNIVQTVSFAPFEQKIVSFSIPISSGIAPSTYAGSLTVTQDSIVVVTTPLAITVNPTMLLSLPSSVSTSADLGSNHTVTFTIANTGNQDLTNLAFTFNSNAFIDDDSDAIGLTFNPASNISLAVGQSRSITVSSNVPADIDPGVYTSTVTLSGPGVSQSFPLSLDVRGILEITDVKVRVSGSSSRNRVSPGETFTVEVEAENTADDIDLEDVEVEVYFEDSSGNRLEDDDGDDLDDDAELQDLDAGDDDKATFTFTMPYDVEDGDTFKVVAIVTARNVDDSSQRFTARDESEEIEANKERHDLEFMRAAFDRTVSCDGSANLAVTIRNRGDEDEDVDLTAQSSALGFSQQASFNLDRDSNDPDFEVTKTFSVPVRNVQSGSYPVLLTARFNGRTKTTSATLTVTACGRTPFDDSDNGDRDDANDGDQGNDGQGTGSGNRPIDVRFDNQPGASGSDFVLRQPEEGFQIDLVSILLVLANLIMLVVVIGGVMKLRNRG